MFIFYEFRPFFIDNVRVIYRKIRYLCQLLNVPWVFLLVNVPQHSYQIFPHYM